MRNQKEKNPGESSMHHTFYVCRNIEAKGELDIYEQWKKRKHFANLNYWFHWIYKWNKRLCFPAFSVCKILDSSNMFNVWFFYFFFFSGFRLTHFMKIGFQFQCELNHTKRNRHDYTKSKIISHWLARHEHLCKWFIWTKIRSVIMILF